MLHLTQSRIGGDRKTSLVILGFGGLILTSKNLRIEKSVIDELADRSELLPEQEAPEITMLTTYLTLIILALNLLWFMQNQMVLKQ